MPERYREYIRQISAIPKSDICRIYFSVSFGVEQNPVSSIHFIGICSMIIQLFNYSSIIQLFWIIINDYRSPSFWTLSEAQTIQVFGRALIFGIYYLYFFWYLMLILILVVLIRGQGSTYCYFCLKYLNFRHLSPINLNICIKRK